MSYEDYEGAGAGDPVVRGSRRERGVPAGRPGRFDVAEDRRHRGPADRREPAPVRVVRQGGWGSLARVHRGARPRHCWCGS